MSNISVLGLGAMGTRMAANLAAAGHRVTVWNRTKATTSDFAKSGPFIEAVSPREAATGADAVVSMLADDEAVTQVWLDPADGAVQGLGADAVAIESSTITPDTAKTLGAAIEKMASFAEAPVVGSRPQAEAGSLFYLLGGTERAVDLALPYIEVNAGATRHVGPVGTAATMKLAINGLFAAQVAAYAEVMGVLDQSDVDTDDAFETLTGLPITSPGLQRILGLIKTRQYEPNFPVELVAKDLRYLSGLAESLGANVPVIDATSGVYQAGAAHETQSDYDIAGIADRYLPANPQQAST